MDIIFSNMAVDGMSSGALNREAQICALAAGIATMTAPRRQHILDRAQAEGEEEIELDRVGNYSSEKVVAAMK
ncbi:hypothetical protein [Mesorhizobium sp. M0322]|uniref:hypothetical protein n=1 Tax=Mesorhizobium sp. M0322 TaxID=2956937 RepID=UPI0033371862